MNQSYSPILKKFLYEKSLFFLDRNYKILKKNISILFFIGVIASFGSINFLENIYSEVIFYLLLLTIQLCNLLIEIFTICLKNPITNKFIKKLFVAKKKSIKLTSELLSTFLGIYLGIFSGIILQEIPKLLHNLFNNAPVCACNNIALIIAFSIALFLTLYILLFFSPHPN